MINKSTVKTIENLPVFCIVQGVPYDHNKLQSLYQISFHRNEYINRIWNSIIYLSDIICL